MVKGEEVIRFREVADVVTVAVGCLRSAVDTSTADSRVSITTLRQVFFKIFLQSCRSFLYALTIQCIVGKLSFHQNTKGGAPGVSWFLLFHNALVSLPHETNRSPGLYL